MSVDSIDAGKLFAAKVLRESTRLNNTNSASLIQQSVGIPVIPTSGWESFQSQDIPVLFNYGHIYHYALESVQTVAYDLTQDGDENDHGFGHMTDKPLTHGRKYVTSGYVHDMMDTKSDKHYFLRAHVWPSMRNELPHNVIIILSVTSGAVIHASCQPCKLSELGRCSHIVSLLLTLLDHVEEHGPALSTPYTSQECSWNKGKKKEKQPKRISDTNYPTKKKCSKIPVIDFDPRPRTC